jgi:transcriptional regulator with XRE-family HTH domain
MAHFAREAGRVRRSRGESIETLAQRSGIEVFRLSRILDGEEDLQTHTVFRIAAALEVGPATLLQGVEWVFDEEGGGHFKIEGADEE